MVHRPVVVAACAALLLASCGPSAGTGLAPSTTGCVAAPASSPTTPSPSEAVSLGPVDFVDGERGWVVAASGSGWRTLRTSDGGATWAALPLGDVAAVHELRFADQCRGWLIAATPDRRLSLRTTSDGGASWSERLTRRDRSSTGAALGLQGLQVGDGDSAWIVADVERCDDRECPSELLATIDGGTRWTAIHPARPRLLLPRFVDARHGWIVRSVAADGAFELAGTRDGGRTWSALALPPFVHDMAFVGVRDGWILGRDGSWCTASFCHRWYLYRTTDGGGSWTTLQGSTATSSAWWLPNPAASRAGFLGGVHFTDERHGWIGLGVGAGGAGQRVGGVITTGDGGLTWEQTGSEPFPKDVARLSVVDARSAWAVSGLSTGGAGGELYRTTDGGRTWTRQLPDRLP
ncbi:MAG: WD40/YVTN/BNR-like repeat-containing protein [Candidatus Limnocylindria bacterium]